MIGLGPRETRLWYVVDVVRLLMRGRTNSTGTVTLTENATTTTVNGLSVSSGDTVLLTPTTANAAGEAGTIYVSSVGQGTFTITHSNDTTTDRTFRWLSMGE
jgi:hypothetical protein